MYADYSYYTQTYGGSIVPQKDWPRAAEAAQCYIDALVRKPPNGENDLVKRALCAAAEELWKQEQGGALKSQTVGSWHKVYADSQHLGPGSRLYHVVALYLSPLGLLSPWC